MEVSQDATTSPSPANAIIMSEHLGNDHAVPEGEDLLTGTSSCVPGEEEKEGGGARRPTEVGALPDMPDDREQRYLRPILVGYAFGPKKMSTMGVVMAEASKSLSTVTMAATRVDVRPGKVPASGISPLAEPARRRRKKARLMASPYSSTVAVPCEDEGSQATHTTAASSSNMSPVPAPRLTSAILNQKNATDLEAASLSYAEEDDGSAAAVVKEDDGVHPRATGGIKFSIAGGPDGSGAGGIRNIIRFFQSSCSSAASFADSSITAGTATTAGGGGCGGGGGMLRGASCADSASCSASTDGAGIQSRSGRNGTRRVQAVRVSFVPIDLDLPLEEQHGGKFDASKFSFEFVLMQFSKVIEQNVNV